MTKDTINKSVKAAANEFKDLFNSAFGQALGGSLNKAIEKAIDAKTQKDNELFLSAISVLSVERIIFLYQALSEMLKDPKDLNGRDVVRRFITTIAEGELRQKNGGTFELISLINAANKDVGTMVNMIKASIISKSPMDGVKKTFHGFLKILDNRPKITEDVLVAAREKARLAKEKRNRNR